MANLNITGSLTEKGKQVVCVEENGGGYIRLTNGMQICWGYVTSASTGFATITFPQPFINTTNLSVVVSRVTNDTSNETWRGAGLSTLTTTQFTTTIASNSPKCWVAIGYWK